MVRSKNNIVAMPKALPVVEDEHFDLNDADEARCSLFRNCEDLDFYEAQSIVEILEFAADS